MQLTPSSGFCMVSRMSLDGAVEKFLSVAVDIQVSDILIVW